MVSSLILVEALFCLFSSPYGLEKQRSQSSKMGHNIQNVIEAMSVIHLLPALPGNAFIFSVNIIDLIKQKRLCVTDQLITGISVFSFVLHFLELHNWFSRVIYSKDLFKSDYTNTVYLRIALVCYLWFSAWLCVHFCLKIVNIKQRFYRLVQKGFPKMFPWILILSLLGSMSVNLPIAVDLMKGLSPPNTTCGCLEETYIAVCIPGFLLCLISAGTIIWSLYRHMRRMRGIADGSRSPNTEAHVRAIKTIASILFVNSNLFTIMDKVTDNSWMTSAYFEDKKL
ncbi:taste receptor type 2 member 7-like [Pelodytes ibericus]